jgi:transcriptional regulator with XRE-family HTH domain
MVMLINMRKQVRLTFGKIIAKARRDLGLQLSDVAALVIRENGRPVSQQYLSDVEHDRRPIPPDNLLEQLADALQVPREYIYLHAHRLPANVKVPVDKQEAIAALRAFCKKADLGKPAQI